MDESGGTNHSQGLDALESLESPGDTAQCALDAPRRSRRQRLRERLSVSLSGLSATWLRISEKAMAKATPGTPGTEQHEDPDDPEAQWRQLWESVAGGGQDGSGATSTAFERWRRTHDGERHSLWNKLATSSDSPRRDWDRVSRSVRSGVPDSLRCAVWTACSGATSKKRQASKLRASQAVTDSFECVESLYPRFVAEGSMLQNEASGVIEVDVPRTGCEEALFEPLRRILLAFAAKNPDIGYCQSMNFITAALLRFCDEESAFWILCSLVEDVLPEGYYTRTMVDIRVDMLVLDSLVMRYLPCLHKHLLENDVDLSPISMSWFLCLYINTFPASICHRVLDCLLHEGCKVLFRTGLALLRLLEPTLLAAGSVVTVYDILRAPFSPDQEDSLLDGMYGFWLQGLSTDILLQLRSEHLAAVRSQDALLQARRASLRASQAPPDP
ncbi:unnamed protein product, partial [Effrenium voratum]